MSGAEVCVGDAVHERCGAVKSQRKVLRPSGFVLAHS